MLHDDGDELTIEDTYVRSEMGPTWMVTIFPGNDAWTAEHVMETYDSFIDDVEEIARDYGIEVEEADPVVEIGRPDHQSVTVNSLDEIEWLKDAHSDYEARKHSWEWEADDTMQFEFKYFDGAHSHQGKNVYEQLGVEVQLDDAPIVMAGELLDTMEEHFGNRDEYLDKVPYGPGGI